MLIASAECSGNVDIYVRTIRPLKDELFYQILKSLLQAPELNRYNIENGTRLAAIRLKRSQTRVN